jgi:hypothetical protein
LDAATMKDLDDIRDLTVYFGHQSVGANILEGLRDIETRYGKGPELKDSLIGRNGDPESKCDDFAMKLAGLSKPPDIALMKFCYLDFDQGTDPEKLFNRYTATLGSLEQKYPSTYFLAVTAPLTTRPAAWRRLVKKIIGSPDVASETNVTRAAFNRLVAKRYEGRPFYDLARVESTFPDGSRNLFSWNGQTAVSLVDAYTDDGGHLNEEGRTRAAVELIHTLASAARAKSARVSPDSSVKTPTLR